MTEQRHVDLIRQGVDVWNAWRGRHPEQTVDLRNVDLRKADLAGANLTAADLSGSQLGKARLPNADLRDAKLSGADLRRGILRGANFAGAKCAGANLAMVDARKTNFGHADLTGASLRQAKLGKAKLRAARLVRTDFLGASLFGADLTEAVLSETLLADTTLANVAGLESCLHRGPSVIDHRTWQRSDGLPINFLRSCGLPENLIDYLPSLLQQPIAYYSCFISYSHDDRSFARRLHNELQAAGIRCWLDEHQILPGDDIYDQIDRGIRLWDKVLLCCSQASLSSWWVDNEIDSAFEKERMLMAQRKRKVLSLIPLDLDGYLFGEQWSSGKKQQIKSRLAADFTGWNSDNGKFQQAFAGLVRSLQADDLAREQPPEPRL